MKILGIDTSCDDTAIGIIEMNGLEYKILSNIRYTHLLRNGGIIPELTSRDHVKYIDLVLEEACKQANVHINDIDVIAATCGPGLTRCLIIGYNFGIALAKLYNKTFIPIHHIEGHILVTPKISFPCCICILSGGHTLLIYCEKFGDYNILGKTLDDAAGEVFDKIARYLGYNNGIDIERLAKDSSTNKILNISMKNSLNFSFSGIKTAVSRIIDSKENIAKILQNTIIANVEYRINKAMNMYNLDSCIVCGGVAANEQIQNNPKYLIPPKELCVDNGVMIAVAGGFHIYFKTDFVNNFNIEIFNRMSLKDFYNTYQNNKAL